MGISPVSSSIIPPQTEYTQKVPKELPPESNAKPKHTLILTYDESQELKPLSEESWKKMQELCGNNSRFQELYEHAHNGLTEETYKYEEELELDARKKGDEELTEEHKMVSTLIVSEEELSAEIAQTKKRRHPTPGNQT